MEYAAYIKTGKRSKIHEFQINAGVKATKTAPAYIGCLTKRYGPVVQSRSYIHHRRIVYMDQECQQIQSTKNMHPMIRTVYARIDIST